MTDVMQAPPSVLVDVTDSYIGGRWHEGAGASLDAVNPSDGSIIRPMRAVSPEQVGAALEAAKAAQPAWAASSYVQRGAFLHRIADEVERNAEDLARVLALEVGKPLTQSRGELQWACDTIRYQAEWGRRITGDIVPSDDPHESIHMMRVPIGVVAAICAWNFPMAMFFRKISPALLTGNTVVLKSSETTPLSALALARVIENAELPPGVLNVITGAGDVGAALVQHPLADLVTMTGSVGAGKQVMSAAAGHLAKISLELGGKAAAIVWDDADLDVAVPALTLARHLNSGQVCTCAERIYVHQAIYDEFMQRYIASVADLTVGDPMTDVDMGPLVSRAQQTKVAGLVEDAVERGAKIAFKHEGGLPDEGFWSAPVVMTDVTRDMPIMQQEVFGPVTPVVPVSTLDEALAAANDTTYGLSGYVFSSSYHVVNRVTREMQCGEIYVNRTLGEAVQGHHSGHKQSGVGGEDGYYGMLRYTGVRTVYHYDAT
jgi:lactaldehyde dehydrogenase / glycolaldehyde dehydrogenase